MSEPVSPEATTPVPALLVAVWEVADQAKAHVAFAHAHATQNTHRREARDSLVALRVAVEEWYALHLLAAGPEGAAATVLRTREAAARLLPTDEQRAALDHTAHLSRLYLKEHDHYARHGSGLSSKHRALVALCKALDVLTFYRCGPVVREDDGGEVLEVPC